MKRLLYTLFLLPVVLYGQNKELSYNEFLGYVKKYHPLVKQAELNISEAQAQLMQARGAFDPKIEVDFDKKQFKSKEYYNLFNASFKVPTWYGIELKAAFDNNEGIYVNPEISTPYNGLTSLGISVPLGQGLFINQRMSDLRQAKVAQQLNTSERDLQILEVIFQASTSYFNWKRTHEELELYENYLKNAEIRKKGTLKLIEEGDKPAIDSVEAGINVINRQLNIEEAKLKLTKARLEVSNYLWTSDNIPLEIGENITPEKNLNDSLINSILINDFNNFDVAQHPKIRNLEAKIDILSIERKLKANMLLPKINVSYNYLSEPNYITNYRFEDYKFGLNFTMPLFLRKERGSLKLANLKIQDTQFKLDFERIQLKNKLQSQNQEVNTIKKQINLNQQLVANFEKMLNAEETLFNIGESSMFLLNSRENSLVSAKLTQISLQNRLNNAIIALYQLWGKVDF